MTKGIPQAQPTNKHCVKLQEERSYYSYCYFYLVVLESWQLYWRK